MKVPKRQIKVGRWIHVKWDDVGVQSAIVVDQEGKDLTLYIPHEKGTTSADVSQVVAVGGYLAAAF